MKTAETTPREEPSSTRVLVVDDEPAVARVYRAALERHGATVETASNGKEAVERVRVASFDVIVSDISMPEMTGIELLTAVRAYDLDVPVILMTGEPGLESAMRAVECGAFRYLAKPVAPGDLWDAVVRAATLHKMAELKLQALELPGRHDGPRLGERAALEVRFSWAMSLLWVAFQPIVGWRQRCTVGYEALLRSDEPLLKNPSDLLDAAARLGRMREVGRAVRARVAAAAPEAPAGAKLFVNLHSTDLNDEDLYAADAPLSRISDRVVLEVTERESLHEVRDVAACVARLRALGFGIAIDDLGDGYAGLASFTQLDPQVAKLDMSLVRGVDKDPKRQSIVGSMRKLCNDLGILVVAEGVETAAERAMLVLLGCDTFQGYLFGRPKRGFEAPEW